MNENNSSKPPTAAVFQPKSHAATRLGVSMSTIDRLISAQRLEVVRFGRIVRISDAAIDKFIEESR